MTEERIAHDNLRSEHKELVNRFDRHLEIYAQNGKEFSALKVEVRNVGTAVSVLSDTLKSGYVPVTEFAPVRLVLFGAVAMILLTVFGMIVSRSLTSNVSSNELRDVIRQELSAYEAPAQ